MKLKSLDNAGANYSSPQQLPPKVSIDLNLPHTKNIVLWAENGFGSISPIKESYKELNKTLYYEVKLGINGVTFTGKKLTNKYVKTLDISSNKFTAISNIINTFVENTGMLNKHSIDTVIGILNIGSHNLGKTNSSNAIVEDFIYNKNGIAIKEANPLILQEAIKYINAIEPSTIVLVHIDDLNDYFQKYAYADFMSLKDVKNVIFLANSNDVSSLPREIITSMFPFNNIIETEELSVEDRTILIKDKFPEVSNSLVDSIAEETYNLSIPDLLTVATSVLVYNKTAKEIIERISLKLKETTSSKSNKKVLKKLYLDSEGNLSAITEEIVDDIIEVKS